MFGLFKNRMTKPDGRALGDFSVEIAENKAALQRRAELVYAEALNKAYKAWDEGKLTLKLYQERRSLANFLTKDPVRSRKDHIMWIKCILSSGGDGGQKEINSKSFLYFFYGMVVSERGFCN